MENKMGKDVVMVAFDLFRAKNLKGRPDVRNQAEYENMLQVWADDLIDIDAHVFIAACKSLSGELTFYPAFAEVRQRCLEMSRGKIESAGGEWFKIKRIMMAACRTYANPGDFENALNGIKNKATREAARLFDWKAFGLDKESNESFHKAQFGKVYKSAVDSGHIEEENERVGLPAPGNVSALINCAVKRIPGV